MIQAEKVLELVVLRARFGNNFPVQMPRVAQALDFLRTRETQTKTAITAGDPGWVRHLRPQDPPKFDFDYALRCRTAIEEVWLTGAYGRAMFASQRQDWPRFVTETDHLMGVFVARGPLVLINNTQRFEERMGKTVDKVEGVLGFHYSPEIRQGLLDSGMEDARRLYEQLVLDPTGLGPLDNWLEEVQRLSKDAPFNHAVYSPALNFGNSLYHSAYGYLNSQGRAT